jgi:hypothetical protein
MGKLLSVAGGGDTVAALAHAGVEEKFSYVSTAGGAFLEWIHGARRDDRAGRPARGAGRGLRHHRDRPAARHVQRGANRPGADHVSCEARDGRHRLRCLDEDDASDNAQEMEDERLDTAWLYIERYYPEVERYREELAQLSSALALAFQVTLVETKGAAEADELADALRHQFLERYFGSNPAVQEFAVEALRRRRRDVALEINQAVKYLGSPRPADTDQFIETVKNVTRWEVRPAPDRSTGARNGNGYRLSGIDWVMFAAVFSIGVVVLAYVNVL